METLLKLGIDWQSIIFYLVNFGLLYLIMAKWVVPPVLKFLDERKQLIAGSISEANDLRETFRQKLAEMEVEQEQNKLEMKSQFEQLQQELAAKRTELLDKMEADRREMMEKAQMEIEAQKGMIMAEAESRTRELIAGVVLKVLKENVPAEVVARSVDEAWVSFKK